VTGEQVYLDRAAAGADWLSGRFMDRHYPNGYIHPFEDDRGEVNNDFSRLMLSAAAIVFAQIDSLTGGKKYTESIPSVMDWVVENSIEDDGAIRIHDGTDAGHHAVTSGPLVGCFTNDDGAGVGLISSYRVTGNEKYKKAAELNGTWWCGLEQMPETYASIPAALLFMLDMYRFTGDKKYTAAAKPYIEKVLELQYINEDDTLAHGGFRGHESACEKSRKLHPDDPLEYICQRTTMYAMIALAKAAADTENEWNIAYSGFGWNGEDI